MQHRKTIDVSLHVLNPINLCVNKAANVMLQLRNTYEGRNFKGSHIVRVREILKMSACRITGNNISAEGDIDVCFLADVVVVAAWDIIPGVTIMRNEQVIVGSTEADRGASDLSAASVAVSLFPTAEAKTLRVGQKVAVRVVQAEHAPMQRSISVVGVLLTCDRAAQVYRLKGALSREAATGLLPTVEAIGRELAERAEMAESRLSDLMFFEMLLYSYASPPKAVRDAARNSEVLVAGLAKWVGPPVYAPLGERVDPVNLLDLIRRAADGGAARVDGLWCRPLGLYRSSPLIAHSAPQKDTRGAAADEKTASAKLVIYRPDGWAKPVEEDAVVAMQTFLSSILNFLYTVRVFATIFSDRAIIDSHFNVWAAMRSAQAPLGVSPPKSPASKAPAGAVAE